MDRDVQDKRVPGWSRSRRFDLERTLADLAEIRGRLSGHPDAVAIVREGREELEQRGIDPH